MTTTFSGPVVSLNGFGAGTSAAPISVATAGNINSGYGTTSAASGDTRYRYEKLTFTAGSGETARFFSVVSGASASGSTINGAHISMSVNTGGSITGAGNALRATLGIGASVSPGGTLSAIQVDSDIGSGATIPGSASFLRFTNSGSGTLTNLMNIPAAMFQGKSAGTHTKSIAVVDSAGTTHYLMCADAL